MYKTQDIFDIIDKNELLTKYELFDTIKLNVDDSVIYWAATSSMKPYNFLYKQDIID